MSLPATLAAVRCVTAMRQLNDAQHRLVDAQHHTADAQRRLERLIDGR